MLPAAVYVCDAGAVVVAFNKRAAELWGRTPRAGDTDVKFCGAHKLFQPDGTHLPHDETPMEYVLRTGEPACDQEVIIERPDGSRVTVLGSTSRRYSTMAAARSAPSIASRISPSRSRENRSVRRCARNCGRRRS